MLFRSISFLILCGTPATPARRTSPKPPPSNAKSSHHGRRTLALLHGGDLHDVVEQRAVHLLEPVRDAVRDDNHVALTDAAALAAFDFLPVDFMFGGFVAADVRRL